MAARRARPTGSGAPRAATRITDWGSLTNLGPNIVVPNASVTSGSHSPVTWPASGLLLGRHRPEPSRARTSRAAPPSRSGAAGTLTLSAAATGTNADENPKVDHRHHAGRGQRCADRRSDPGHGNQHRTPGSESTFASFAESGVASRWVLVEHEYQRSQRPQPRHRHRQQRDPAHRAAEQLRPGGRVRDRRLPVARLRGPGDRGGDHALHRVQRRVQHQPLRGRRDDRRDLVLRQSRSRRTPPHRPPRRSSPTTIRPPSPCSTSG